MGCTPAASRNEASAATVVGKAGMGTMVIELDGLWPVASEPARKRPRAGDLGLAAMCGGMVTERLEPWGDLRPPGANWAYR